MAWFSIATKHFSKSAGGKTLHPVLDLNSAERFKPFCVVKRKTSFWPWKHPKMTPTLLVLNDVLLQKIDNVAASATLFIEKYEDKPQLKMDGDLGTKLASELSLDISTVDSFSMDAKFGDIIKTEVNWEKMEAALKQTKVNMSHELLLEVAGQKRTSLCLVLESLANKRDCLLTASADERVSTDDSVNVPHSPVTINVHAKGNVESIVQHSYEITPGTVLSYSCNILDIKSDGSIKMHTGTDKIDNKPATEVAAFNPDAEINELKKEVDSLLGSSNLKEVAVSLQSLLGSTSLQELLDIVASAHMDAEEKNDYKISTRELSELLGDKNDIGTGLLKAVGFVSQSSGGESVLCHRASQDRQLLQSCWGVLECLDDLSTAQQVLLQQLSAADKKTLLHVAENGLKEKMSFAAEGDLKHVLKWSGAEKELFNSLGFTVEGQKIKFHWHKGDLLKDVYVTLLVLINV